MPKTIQQVEMAAVGDHVLVLRAQMSKMTAGGIELAQKTIDGTKLCYGVALRCGDKVKQVEPGDIVVFDAAESREVFFDNEDKTAFSVLNEMGIYAKMNLDTTQGWGLTIPTPDASWNVTVK